MNKGYFDVVLERVKQHCDQCGKVTEQDKPKDSPSARFTCRDPGHRHPTREEQEQMYAKKEYKDE